MQNDDLPPEQARELAQPKQCTVQQLMDKLPDVDPWWMRDALPHFGGDRAELESRLIQRMEEQTQELPRVYMGLMLFFLGHPLGKAAFLEGLRSVFPKVSALVLNQLRVFRLNDLGHDGQPGQLPVSREEVCAALLPFKHDPAGPEGRIALEFVLGHGGLDFSRPHLRPLLDHADPTVRDQVLRAYLEHGLDDGALDILAAELLEPAVAGRQKTSHWRRARHSDCRALKYCAKTTPDGGLRRRIGALVLRIARETLTAPDIAERTDAASGWLDGDELLQTLILTQPEGADAVLQQLIETETAPVSLRCQAVLGYFELTGHKPRGAEAVVGHTLQMPATSASGKQLAQFIQHGLVAMDTLARAVATSGWAYPVTQTIKAWPRGPDDTLAVSGLTEALAGWRRLAATRAI